MPRLGANIDKVKILSWNVKVGDSVNAGDSVIVIEAMKKQKEIQASKSGVD